MNNGWLVVPIALVALMLGACRGGNTKSKRTGSAAPVEVVAQPELPDAGTGPGANVEEIEPNDGEEVATPLVIGGTARGRIDGEVDADYYRLDIDKAGVLQAMLSGVDGQDLTLELIDSTGASLKSDRGGARVKEGIPNARILPGRYTLIVRQLVPKKKKATRKRRKKGKVVEEAPPPAPVYELTVQLVTPPPGAEREPDDDRGTANELILADNATGFIGWSGDHDVWKLSVETLSERNAIDIEVSAVEGVALSLAIANGIGQTLATRKGARGQPLVVRGIVPLVPEGGSPFYYLTVSGDRSNPETTYTLHARAELLGPDPELEPNDDIEQPQQIPPDRTVVHASWSPGDIDHFAIAPSSVARTLDVTLDVTPDLDLEGELLVDGKSVATANKGGKGVIEKLTAQLAPGQGAIVRVRNPDPKARVEAQYDIKVQESTASDDNAP